MVSGRAATRSGQMIFGRFRLIPARKLLLDGEKPVRLGSRACDILIALVERPGQLLSNQELMHRVWPNAFVEEGNLRVHMAALRRALGDGQAGNRYIANTPGRGYSFVAPVSLREDPAEDLVLPQTVERHPEMPAPLARIVGRSDIVHELGAQLQQHRFVTIVGPGGIDDMLSVCQALVQAACPVALFVGDLEAVERYVAMLLDYSARQGLDFWQAFGHCFQGVLLIKRGHVGDGLARLGRAIEELREIQFGVYYGVFLSEFADALGRVGRAEEGLAAIDEALARAERNEERWYLAELLRIKGELVRRHSAPDGPRQAERYLLESLEWSRQQHILSWELRTSISLAALWRDQNRTGDAQNLITPIYARFAEGFGAADLRAAKQLMKELGCGEGERQGDV